MNREHDLAIKDPDVAAYERLMEGTRVDANGDEIIRGNLINATMNNPKKRGHALHKPVPISMYAKVNEGTKKYGLGYLDKDGNEAKVKLPVATLINPLNHRRATRKARKAAKLAALVH